MTNISKFILLFLATIVIVSCTPAIVTSLSNKESVKDKIKIYISNNDYNSAKELSIEAVKKHEKDWEFLALLAISYYKTGNIEVTNKLFNKIISNNQSIDFFYSNRNFDYFYYYINSIIGLGKYKKAKEQFFLFQNTNFLSDINMVKLKLLEIKLNYYDKNYKIAISMINKLLKNYRLNSDIINNLYYLESNALFHINNFEKTIELLNRILKKSVPDVYVKKYKLLVDKITYSCSSDFMDNYNVLLLNIYDNLYKYSKNSSLKLEILRDKYSLENSNISFVAQSNQNSNLTKIKLSTGRDNTQIIFSSNDTINYDYKYNGTNLILTFFSKAD